MLPKREVLRVNQLDLVTAQFDLLKQILIRLPRRFLDEGELIFYNRIGSSRHDTHYAD